MQQREEFFLSRLNFGTKVAWEEEGKAVDAQEWLDSQPLGMVDRVVWLGASQRLRCRLLAFRVPPEVAAQRRRKLRDKVRDERGAEPSAARLAWCDWVILVTNVPAEKLTIHEALVLYRARWQIELLFKRWKSQDLVAVLTGSTATRQTCRQAGGAGVVAATGGLVAPLVDLVECMGRPNQEPGQSREKSAWVHQLFDCHLEGFESLGRTVSRHRTQLFQVLPPQ